LLRHLDHLSRSVQAALIGHGMAAGIQANTTQFDTPTSLRGSIRNIDQTAGQPRSQYAFDCAGHPRAGFTGANHLDAVECGQRVAAGTGSQRPAVELEVARDSSLGVRCVQSRAKDFESVAACEAIQNNAQIKTGAGP
jgi:hypothetical protein